MILRLFGLAALITVTAALSGAEPPARAEVDLPREDAPVPTARPSDEAGDEIGLPALGYAADAKLPGIAIGEPPRLAAGLDAVSAGDIARARTLRDALAADSLDRRVLDWAIALSGDDEVSSAELEQARRQFAGWPAPDTIRRNFERALVKEDPAPEAVIQAFAGERPLTTDGIVILARAQVALGNADAARALLVPFWHVEPLAAKDEAKIIAEFGALIPQADYLYRMERMLYAERTDSAGRVAGLAGAEALATAWSAVIRNRKNAGQLLDAVPEVQRGAGYLFARAKFLRRAGKYEEAAKVLEAAPRDAAALVDPDEWWVERRLVSRALFTAGDAAAAYAVTSVNAAESPATTAEAEFHAGWFALRGLKDAAKAAPHFARIAEVANGPISLARANYWLGRAAEAGGPGVAREFFEKAAQYGTTFYGQLADARLKGDAISLASPEPDEKDSARLAARPEMKAIERLETVEEYRYAAIFYRALARGIDSPGELALLTARAEARGDHFLSLKLAKIAAARGIDVGALTHPLGVIPADIEMPGDGKALAYAVARQESEFNVAAVSGAGARGLLQLLPGTAREMAKEAGLSYSAARLTTDAGYNAALGAAYLARQLERFTGSYVLTFAGYNAGPRRATEWIAQFGDPRGADVDTVVDWIESIPYTETRNYVQRVMENLEVYKMRLTGHFDIVADLTAGG